MASFLQSLIDPKKNWFARQHMKALTQRLRNYGNWNPNRFLFYGVDFEFSSVEIDLGCITMLGLRYDDLYDPYYDIDVKEALNRLPREIVDARNQRLKRAMDLSMKHQYLSDDLQVFFCFYLLIRSVWASPKNRNVLDVYHNCVPKCYGLFVKWFYYEPGWRAEGLLSWSFISVSNMVLI